MAKTASMRLVELMVLKQDISRVIEFLGKKKNFQFQSNVQDSPSPISSPDRTVYEKLQSARAYLNIDDCTQAEAEAAELPTDTDIAGADKLILAVEELRQREVAANENFKRVKEANSEAVSFSNLKVPYEELDHLSFLSLRIGRIDPSALEELKFAAGTRAVIVPLGGDNSRILAAASKKGRFALDTELKKFGFVNMEIPKDFKGVPDEVLASLGRQQFDAEKALGTVSEERVNFASAHASILRHLLASFSLGMQVQNVQSGLESTQLVYRITGWLPERDCHDMMKTLDGLTERRIAIRVYEPQEVPSVAAGHEKVPVQLHHGKLVGSFERMIFSYGSPLYGSVDPTPFVALFFTLLFGIMFGDAGQGLVFLLIGILMEFNVIKVGGWNKFAPVFMSIGCSSTIMGLLTGEFFANSQILLPFSSWVKTLCGVTDPVKLAEPILDLMPSAERITSMFMFFGFTVAVGFVINSIGLIINIVNLFARRQPGKALFGKTGISGSCFFWYVVVMAVRIAAFHHAVAMYDWGVIGVTLALTAFGEPLSRLVDGEKPVFENGLGTAIIEGFVEVLEVVSSYLSNSVSFLRVGAFALAHAVLGYIIASMVAIAPGPAGILVSVLGNTIVIVLEGMIVAIQVIRLQYYEFFSKFFNETGREFKPFAFEYIHE